VKLTSIAIVAAACWVSGCAISNPSASSATPGSGNVTGNWQLIATSTQTPFAGAANPLGIFLTAAGGTVSGIPWIQEAFPTVVCATPTPQCEFPFEGVSGPMSGTIDANGNLVLSSVASSGTIFTITAMVGSNGVMSGTYTITGIPFPDQGTVSANMIGMLDGTYTGTVVSSETGASMGMTTTLTQTATPDAMGFLRVTESATFTGSPCFTTAVMQGPAATYSGFLGNVLQVNLVAANNPDTFIVASGAVAPDAKTIQFHYDIAKLPGSSCTNDYGGGTLTLQ